MDEFDAESYRGVSLRKIVKMAGVTTGAFYGYYDSKGDMVIYYNKLYKSLKDKNVSNPEKSDWELIEKDK